MLFRGYVFQSMPISFAPTMVFFTIIVLGNYKSWGNTCNYFYKTANIEMKTDITWHISTKQSDHDQPNSHSNLCQQVETQPYPEWNRNNYSFFSLSSEMCNHFHLIYLFFDFSFTWTLFAPLKLLSWFPFRILILHLCYLPGGTVSPACSSTWVL